MLSKEQKRSFFTKKSPKTLLYEKKLAIFEPVIIHFTPIFTTMEDIRKSGFNESDKDIVHSQAIKAGKRIYYIDVKKNRKEEMYISITESKKIVQGEGENASFSFEKHKIFLYREDFAKIAKALGEAISFVIAEQGEYIPPQPEPPTEESQEQKVDIDIDF